MGILDFSPPWRDGFHLIAPIRVAWEVAAYMHEPNKTGLSQGFRIAD